MLIERMRNATEAKSLARAQSLTRLSHMTTGVRGAGGLRLVGDSKLMAEAPLQLLGTFLVRGGETRIGGYCDIGDGSESQGLVMGRYCEVGPGAVLSATGHPLSWLSVSPFQYKAASFNWHETANNVDTIDPEAGGRESFRGDPVVIGNDVWVGSGAVILRGVSIADGAVIAANAVVTRDVEPYEIVGGVPARTLKMRVTPDQRDEILELAWWRFTPNQLSGISFDDLPRALAQLRERVGDLEPREAKYEPVTKSAAKPATKPVAKRRTLW